MPSKTTFRFTSGFLVLFVCYHAAEYMIVFLNSAAGFLVCSAAFFLAAVLIGKLQGNGLRQWGFSFSNAALLQGITGLLAGLAVYGTAFLFRLALNMETIVSVPETGAMFASGGLLLLGCFISSLTEDLLTRSYVFAHLRNKVQPATLVLLSAAIFTLNHIYRLNEPLYILFIFLTGIHLAIPLLLTRNIWYTTGLHWAGNIVYQLTSNIMQTTAGSNPFPALAQLLPFMVLLIPANYLICKAMIRPADQFTYTSPSIPVRRPASVIRPD